MIMAELCFELFNNQLVHQLVGVADNNLRLIEKMLNVEILSFVRCLYYITLLEKIQELL